MTEIKTSKNGEKHQDKEQLDKNKVKSDDFVVVIENGEHIVEDE